MQVVKGFVGIKSMKFSEIPSFFFCQEKNEKSNNPFEMPLGGKKGRHSNVPQKNCRIGFIQNEIPLGQPQNAAHALLARISKLLCDQPDLILLPEVFLGGPPTLPERAAYAQIHTDFAGRLGELARHSGTFFYGSVIERGQNGNFFNTALLIGPNGKPQKYRKAHLFKFDGEHRSLAAGNTATVMTTPWGKAAPLVCYDIRFPELLRAQTFSGARFALVCAQWPKARQSHWEALLRARAIENQVFVFACNRVGTKRELKFAGGSCVISPWGDTLLRLGESRRSGVCDVDLTLVETTRARYPFLQDAKKRRIRFDI